MAVLNPVAFLCHRQRSALLVRKLTPGNEVVVQAGGRAVASASSNPPAGPSGPVRYVQKGLPCREADGGGKGAPETRKPNGLGASQRDSSDEGETCGESNSYRKSGYLKTSRARRRKSSSELGLSTPFRTAAGEGKLTTGRDDEGEEEEEGQEDVIAPDLDSVRYLFGDGHNAKTHVGDVEVDQPRRRVLDKDPGSVARNYVMGLLARGPQTELNLRIKMSKKNVPEEVIDATIKDFQRWGLQSDEEYAEVFARCRWTDNTWGPKRIKYELLRRGIQKDTVEAALVKLFQTSDAAGDKEEEEDLGKWGMTTEAAKHLIAQARKRWSQGDVKVDVKRRRMIGWLQRRGFSWSVIPDLLKIIERDKTT